MVHKDPNFWEAIKESVNLIGIPFWAYFLALGGAIVHNARKMSKDGAKFSLKEFIADTIICLSIGYVTYYICKTQELSFEATVIAISLSSGMGNKYYDKIEELIGEVIGGVINKWLRGTK